MRIVVNIIPSFSLLKPVAPVSNLRFRLRLGKIGIIRESEYSTLFRYRNNADFLFYNRGLRCLVAIELKIGEFEPEHLGKMEFYLEALDRDIRKTDENPSVGLILCTKKDATVVEYALSRSLSPAMIADYKLHLPDKRILENKLRELAELVEASDDVDNDETP